MTRKAIVLLSGGVDSTTVLAIAKREGFQCYALSFDYGQRHRVELDYAAEVARILGAVEHKIVHIDLRAFGGSALTSSIPVPHGRTEKEIATGIPITYVPARNTIFLSFALAYGEVVGARDLFIGVNAIDYSGYPDCRPEFIEAFQHLANLATRSGVEENGGFRIHTPLINLTKSEIIQKGMKLGVEYARTHSCYDPSPEGKACGQCDSCLLRLKGFREAGCDDPAAYTQGKN
ncbi:MAG: 7-cyano-7-deazaguanine synthase QueC [Nitrospinae bacterium CG11_big_fil_rev_8_21_14_0_20_56_8]|nr:MAG: 7-cyano-7-deazaguanine synthase QueC [Nitrospinae bacterium CG11_big_fil_rev_8_21_14_0_20_56_8]